MISVEEAQRRILADFAPLPAETVSLAAAQSRVLAEDVAARLTQPRAAVSAMDGYAVRAADVARPPVTLRQVGVVPAGAGFAGVLGPGGCVRIFTGAPLPEDADAIVIQENAEARGEDILVREPASPGRYVRPAGLDFRVGQVLLRAGRRLTARDIGLAAAMNVPWLRVRRRPRVAILATGDELALPGDPLGPNQIVSSSGLALAALVAAGGGEPIDLGIAPDDVEPLRRLAGGALGADLLLTCGGASVGDYDLVREGLGAAGLVLDFWKVAMRPGKPLMFGRLGPTPLLGLPGNPVSAMVCALLYVLPILGRLLGAEESGPVAGAAQLGRALPANDQRQDYLRAALDRQADGGPVATPFDIQDSSMLTPLAAAGCLVIRRPFAAAAAAGETVEILDLGCGPGLV